MKKHILIGLMAGLFAGILTLFTNATITKNVTNEKTVTFFAVGDLHIGKSLQHIKGGDYDNGELIEEVNKKQIHIFNRSLDDVDFQDQLRAQGISPDVTGLIIAGDITDNGTEDELRKFENLYGLSAKETQWDPQTGTYKLLTPRFDNKLKLRVFETIGNHDYEWGPEKIVYQSIDQVQALRRLKRRNIDVTHRGYREDRLILSADKIHYAIKYPGVNLIVAHLGAKISNRKNEIVSKTVDTCEDDEHLEDTEHNLYRNVHAFNSLSFLETILQNHTNGSTKLILNIHYPIFINRYNHVEKNALYTLLNKYRKKAKIIAMVSAHRHKTAAHNWCGIPVIEGGSPLQLTHGITKKGIDPEIDATFAAIQVTPTMLNVNTVAWNSLGKITVATGASDCNLAKSQNKCFRIRKWISNINLSSKSQCAIERPTIWGQNQ